MLAHLRPALVMLVLFTALTGLAYPLAVTGLAQVVLPSSANGSLVSRNGTTVGSALIGQSFSSEKYFRGRPSAAGEKGYDAAASSGSNMGSTSKKLIDRVNADVAALRGTGAPIAIPADAVTTSASGLDPHISPTYALLQVPRVAVARRVSEDRVRALLDRVAERPFLGVIGEPRVNVLQLNLMLDFALAGDAG